MSRPMSRPREGDLFGRYRIVRIVGNGGMGVVFEAEDEALAHRTVALKVISGQFADEPEFRSRFRREAESLATLDSPHVITIHDYGEIDGAAYLAMQFVRGGDLGHLLNTRGSLRARTALNLTAQLAAGLGEAHEAGIIHRDIKPSNVLLRDAASPELHGYLCDFGIAHVSQDERFTTHGSVVGSWHYLAPERGKGAAGSVASDIYSLGCVLWAMLTGGAPYTGSDAEIARGHTEDPPRQLIGRGPAIDHVNRILATAMAKEPGDRFGSTDELRQQLLAPVPEAPTTPGTLETPTRMPGVAGFPPEAGPYYGGQQQYGGPDYGGGDYGAQEYGAQQYGGQDYAAQPYGGQFAGFDEAPTRAPGVGQPPQTAPSEAPWGRSDTDPDPALATYESQPSPRNRDTGRQRGTRRTSRWLAAAAAVALVAAGGWWAATNLGSDDDSGGVGQGAQGSGNRGNSGEGIDRNKAASSTGGTVASDIDGDGNGDLVGWFTADLSGEWSTDYWYSRGSEFTRVSGSPENDFADYGDLDRDGIPDTISVIADSPSSGEGSYRLNVGLNNKAPSNELTSTRLRGVPLVAENAGHDTTLGDFDGDGDLDVMVLVASSKASTTFWFLAGNGDGTFGPPREWHTMTDAQIYYVWAGAADFDADGDSDLLVERNSTPATVTSNGVSYEGGYELLVLDSTGKGFEGGPTEALKVGDVMPRVHVAEVSEDGEPVVFAYNDLVPDAQTLDAFTVDDQLALSPSDQWSVALDTKGDVNEEFAVGDYNGDELVDIAYSLMPPDGGRTPIEVRLSNGQGFDKAKTWGHTPTCKAQTCYVSLGVGQ